MSSLAPWAGWIGGIAGWAVSAQFGTSFAQLDCAKADPLAMLLIGLTGGAAAIAGGLTSLSIWRRPGDLSRPYASARRFIAATGALAAGIFLLAILFQTIASFIIPQCHA